ncbi:MAG: GNAT family N-acetyltransferase [Desulfobulbaceae bacterium]|nr:GNAT family N-acetyltransferase [Desulfobulbaceae bacterium]
MIVQLREFRPSEALAINAIAVAAFAQYRDLCSDWPGFEKKIADMAALAAVGEIIVAERNGEIVGAVAYLGSGVPKAPIFDPSWPIMRMLVVAPEARGAGVGRALAEGCLARARRDQAGLFALHTSPIMAVALSMYERMGFGFWRAAPVIHGVPYGIYVKSLR